jgi:hypothetical protein
LKIESGGESRAVRANEKVIAMAGWGLHVAFFGRKVEMCGEGEAQGSDAAPVSPRAALRPN